MKIETINNLMPKKKGLSSTPPLQPQKKRIYLHLFWYRQGPASPKEKTNTCCKLAWRKRRTARWFPSLSWMDQQRSSMEFSSWRLSSCQLHAGGPIQGANRRMYPSPRLFHPPETDATARSCFKWRFSEGFWFFGIPPKHLKKLKCLY